MKAVFYGDSITVGTYTAVGERAPVRIACPNYSQILGQHFGWEIVNEAINGVSYSRTSSVNGEWAVSKRIAACPDCDVLFLAAGTNDYGTSVQLGNEDDRTDNSFFGALNIAFSIAKDKAKQVYVITPIPRKDQTENKDGHTLDDYRNALRVVAKKFGYKVINGENLPINPNSEEDKLKYIYDTHALALPPSSSSFCR